MIKLIKTYSALLALAVLSACGSASPQAGGAVVVWAEDGATSVKGASKNPEKKGESCSLNILGLVTTGDESIDKAMANGNIKVATSIDKDIKGFAYYIIFAKSCTVVRGY